MMDDIEEAIEKSVVSAIKKVRSMSNEDLWKDSIISDSEWVRIGVEHTLDNLVAAEGGGLTVFYPTSLVAAHEYFLNSPAPETSEAIAKLIYDVPSDDRSEVVRAAVIGTLILHLIRQEQEAA